VEIYKKKMTLDYFNNELRKIHNYRNVTQHFLNKLIIIGYISLALEFICFFVLYPIFHYEIIRPFGLAFFLFSICVFLIVLFFNYKGYKETIKMLNKLKERVK
jgi:glucan phosphoethanolaminetransferase (alkaline phosphatase superfamily)